MLSKILLYTIRENQSPIKAMFFDGSFFLLKEFCKQFNIHWRIRSQKPKTTGIRDKDLN